MRIPRRSFLALLASAAASTSLRSAQATPPDSPTPANDPLRPEFHLMPQHNWMNDPNGPIFWKGNYHLFYQLNPHAAVWGDMHWGHAISTDMIHWRHEPIALAPTPGGPDSEGCFSGSAVVDQGTPTFIYTGVQNAAPHDVTLHDAANKLRETQLLAIAEDVNLLRWKKLPQPVIAAPPAGMNVTGFRDPCPWREADGWYLAVGSGERGKGGCALLYRSQDLRHWEYLHPLAQGQPTGSTAADPVDSGDMWECPDFFEVDGRHCLLYSTERKVYWTTGDYDRRTHRFTPTRQGILDYGAYYAPKSFLAPDGRRILWGWIPETRPQAEYAAAGWAGCMSLPRVLGVNAEDQLTMRVAAEAEKLRGTPMRGTLKGGAQNLPLDLLHQEVALNLAPHTQSATLRLLVDKKPAWELLLDWRSGTGRCADRSFPLPARAAAPAQVRLYLDASVLEAFIGDTAAITTRCYTLRPSHIALEVTLDAAGSGAWT
ncbi:MAG: glycoside hydrolase family 32 protein, partial [Acidobacteriota bacterium]|nr:glycoside hydrolase family 32 protein [Acidobacteriota bacterium]